MSNYLGPYLLGPNDENQGIYTGDAREKSKAIPDESVDLIFADPVYDQIDDYRWLAETASRVLKLDSACLAWYGGPSIGLIQREMEQYLKWTWLLNYVVLAKGHRLIGYNIFLWTTHCLWFRKGNGIPQKRMPDTFVSSQPPSGTHRWNKNLEVSSYWVSRFIEDGIVFDPFTGGGTVPAVCKMLGRRWLAFEIDPDTAELARERVRNTQPPLPLVMPEQEEMVFMKAEALAQRRT